MENKKRMGQPIKHGMSKTNLYKSWYAMKNRCYNKNDPYYSIYGARGVKVCEKWQSFMGFYEDMGDRPTGMTLDRINNDGDYEPENCRWADNSVQNRNRRDNVFITHDGITMCLKDWASKLCISSNALSYRLKIGLSLDKIFTTGKIAKRNHPATQG